jgi:hypothetical protein
MTDGEMTPQERQQLRQLMRIREQRAKRQVEAFASERLAQFEQEMATIYRADDERWARISRAVGQLEQEANAELRRVCEAEGIREEFAPSFHSYFSGRSQNADASRRGELRKVAQTRVRADMKAAKVAIETASADVQERLLVGGLRTDEARELVEQIPSVESLMPSLPTAEIIQIEEANGHKRPAGYASRQLPPVRVPALEEPQERAS